MYHDVTFTLIFCAVLTWDHIFVLGQTVPQEAAQLFDDIEVSVQSIAKFALANYQNGEGLWNICNKDTNCSPYACKPLQLDTNNSECVAAKVDPGPVCQVTSPNSVGCNNATMSTGSYIRLPPLMDETKLSCDAEMTICAQKDLDHQAFENVYANDGGPFNNIAWSMFGAPNGVYRIYPGLELRPENCRKRTYDPRKRPWFKAVTGVSKELIVLLDTGGSMATPMSVVDGVPVFTAAQQIVTEFVDTLNVDDIVSVYTFDNSEAKKISQEIQISRNDTENVALLGPLKEAINGIEVTSNAAQANLTSALEAVLLDEGFANTGNATAESLKILIIITGGELAEGRSITIPSRIIRAAEINQVRTFLCHLNDSSQQADVSKLADLQPVACSLGGIYDQIPRNNILADPLSSLGSFYSYVAAVRFDLDGGRTLWVPSYDAYSGIGAVMSVVYPVFDDNVLVGVANIELLRDTVERNWPGAIGTARKPADIKQTRGSPLNCNISLSSRPFVCSGSDRGLCLDPSLAFANTQLDYTSRTCCDSRCTGVAPSPGGGGSKAAIIAGAVGGAASVLLLMFLCCYWRPLISGLCCRRMRKSPPATPPRPPPLVSAPNFNGVFDVIM